MMHMCLCLDFGEMRRKKKNVQKNVITEMEYKRKEKN